MNEETSPYAAPKPSCVRRCFALLMLSIGCGLLIGAVVIVLVGCVLLIKNNWSTQNFLVYVPPLMLISGIVSIAISMYLGDYKIVPKDKKIERNL